MRFLFCLYYSSGIFILVYRDQYIPKRFLSHRGKILDPTSSHKGTAHFNFISIRCCVSVGLSTCSSHCGPRPETARNGDICAGSTVFTMNFLFERIYFSRQRHQATFTAMYCLYSMRGSRKFCQSDPILTTFFFFFCFLR